jgi:putative transposase
VLWSFVYLVARNLLALVWPLGRPRRAKELEILVLRHELAILRRQPSRPRLTQADRALLAALSRSLPRATWAAFSFKPETLLRWHRQLIARRWTYSHRMPGRPPLERSLRELILRLARENPHWGYKRIVGELKGLGIAVSATSVRKVLLEAGLQPAPQRTHSSWRAFLRNRDTKFSRAFDEVFLAEGIKVIRTPIQAPNANAFAERWIRTVRADCLDRILILGRRHLERVLRVYRRHYNEHRPHRALQLLPPDGRDPTPPTALADLPRRDLLGGLIHEYEAA